MTAEIAAIEADGPLGEVLRSASVAPALRDKIREALLTAMAKSTAMDNILLTPASRFVTIPENRIRR